MRVLIVKSSALGDIIHALPVLDYLKQVSSGIEIDWVVEEHCKDVLEGNPLIAQLQVLRTRAWRKRPFAPATWREMAAFKRGLLARQYRIVFDIQGNCKSGVVDWLTQAPAVLGFSEEVLQERVNAWFTSRKVPIKASDYHITDQYLRVVSVPYGRDFRTMQLHADIATTTEDDQAAELLLATLGDGLVFLFQYGTTWQTKFWSEEGWIALGQSVRRRYPEATILFSWGTEAERSVVTRLSGAIGSGARVIDRFSLKELAALLKKVDLVVGGDTGPVHLAAAVGTPTVSLYRASDGKRSGPRGNQHVVIQAPMECTACFRTRCDKDGTCRASITAERVLAGIEEILRKDVEQ